MVSFGTGDGGLGGLEVLRETLNGASGAWWLLRHVLVEHWR